MEENRGTPQQPQAHHRCCAGDIRHSAPFQLASIGHLPGLESANWQLQPLDPSPQSPQPQACGLDRQDEEYSPQNSILPGCNTAQSAPAFSWPASRAPEGQCKAVRQHRLQRAAAGPADTPAPLSQLKSSPPGAPCLDAAAWPAVAGRPCCQHAGVPRPALAPPETGESLHTCSCRTSAFSRGVLTDRLLPTQVTKHVCGRPVHAPPAERGPVLASWLLSAGRGGLDPELRLDQC